jgi:hypothetical protein
MGRSDEENSEQQAWKTLSEAGLVEIRVEEFAERIRDVKRLVQVRLRELLDFDAQASKSANPPPTPLAP